ncbi:MAG: hypothetical protein LBQ82_05275 [Treponema sp.]|jgi:hypothetical protein|nr:hypothetical protein [Treponema sp.]
MGENTRANKNHLRFADIVIVILCLSVMAYSVNLFRNDLYQTINLQNVQPVGTITIKNNTVQRRIADRVLWDRLRVESPVYLGDIIRVAELSEATLNIEDQHIDIEENTLIRILLSPDGSGALQIELTDGNIGVTTDTESGGLQLNLMGRVIETGAGTTLTAAAGKDGIALQVTEGKAVFIEEGASREISSGTMIALNDKGIEQLVPSAVVTQPRPNARYVKSTPQSLSVRFAWNRVNLRPQDTLRLEIAADRNFSRIVQSVENLASSAEVSLEAGTWNWRLLYENTTLSTGRITVVEAENLNLLSPARGSLFRYRDEPPSLRFQWSEIEEASHYVIEIASSSDFANLRINRQITAPFFVDSSLSEGTWYWRVQPVFSSVYEGGASFSNVSFFRIEQTAQTVPAEQTAVMLEGAQLRELERSAGNEPSPEPVIVLAETPPAPAPTSPPRQAQAAPPLLPVPANRVPANNYRIGIEQLKTQRNLIFRWTAVQGANAYILTLYEQAGDGRRQINRVTVTNPAWTLENVNALGRGTFVWQIEAVSRNSGGTITRRGTAGENTFTMDIPLPAPVQMDDPGVLYGF